MWYESPYKWNGQVTGYGDYGTGIANGTVTTTGAITKASIALLPDYLGTDDETLLPSLGWQQPPMAALPVSLITTRTRKW
jgi:hypothetical protein